MGTQRKGGISWCDATWNPIVGCSKVSEGCWNCWAEKQARLHYHDKFPEGWHKAGGWYQEVFTFPDRLEWPLHKCKPLKIAVALMGDLFHEKIPYEFIDKIFAVMALCPQHTFQVLTKRAIQMNGYLCNRYTMERITKSAIEIARKANVDLGKHFRLGEYPTEMGTFSLPNGLLRGWPLPNVWLGVSCENQAAADERIPLLLQTPAAVRFVSIEPMLGPIDLETVPLPDAYLQMNGITGVAQPWTEKDSEPDDYRYFTRKGFKLDWVIAGSESGPKRRASEISWFRSLKDQCVVAGIPFHLKQMDIDGKLVKRPMLDGREWLEFPELYNFKQGSLKHTIYTRDTQW